MKRASPSLAGTERRVASPALVGGNSEIQAIVDAVRVGKCCRFIGPRYHHKSRVMRAACGQVDRQLGYASLYLSLRDTRAESEEVFYRSIYALIVHKARRYYHRRLPKETIRSVSDLKLFLTRLPNLLHSNVALFIDDLEMQVVPPDYLGNLLKILRAAYEDTATSLRLIAVVCAANHLAHTTLGPTSPFENISKLVILRDLMPSETITLARQLISKECPQVTMPALNYIYQQTAGDRFLVTEVCAECCRLIAVQHVERLTLELTRVAFDGLMEHGGQRMLAEGIHQIEADPQLLRAILLLMQHDEVAANELPIDLTLMPDPLSTSGFVSKRENRYRIKSDLHKRLLERALSDEQIGRIFLAAGDMDQATHFLIESSARGVAPEERSRVMLSFVSAMYSMADKRAAFDQLARGLQVAYPVQPFRLYEYDRRQQALVLLAASSDVSQPKSIALNSSGAPEIKALNAPQEYSWYVTGPRQLTCCVPLRIADHEKLGLVVIEQLVSPRDFRQRQTHVLELVGYLRHASRALKNRIEYARLHQQIEQRAKDRQFLLKVTQELMSTQGTFDEVLKPVLHGALRALHGHAQKGSIWIYHPEKNILTMDANVGYPKAVQADAYLAPGQGVAGYVYSRRRFWNVQDTEAEPRYVRLAGGAGPHVLSTIGVPLLGRRSTLGVLFLDSVKEIDAFDAESEQLLKIFAGQVALWLEKMRLVETLQNKRDVARLAAELVHQITGVVASIPEVADELSIEVQDLSRPEVAQELISELKEKATDIAEIGEWLKKFIKVGGMSLERFEVGELIASVCERVQEHQPTHIELRQPPRQVEKLAVCADRALISILLENLLNNAFEAIPVTRRGEVGVQFAEKDGFCAIEVWDNGPGIPPEHCEQIWHVGWTTKDKSIAGYTHGLGLPLCRHIVTAHQGTLTLRDSPAGGANFVVRLPADGPEIGIGEEHD